MLSSLGLSIVILCMLTNQLKSVLRCGWRASRVRIISPMVRASGHLNSFRIKCCNHSTLCDNPEMPQASFIRDKRRSTAIAPKLTEYMRSRFETAFASRLYTTACSDGPTYADTLLSLLAMHPIYSRSNSEFSSICEALCKSIPMLKEADLQLLLNGHLEVQSILELHENHVKKNRHIFDTIQKHHRSISREDWSDVARNEEALAKYSQAAAAMGDKKWVVECNEWMESFAIGYFKLGGARKHFLREYFKVHDRDFSSGIEKKAFINQFTKDLLQDTARKQIRLLDVGSCYNPIARSENSSQFDVTAIDLYPADPSVLRCDFLNLTVGSADSAPIIIPTTVETAADSNRRTAHIPSIQQLAQLPAHSFDAVTMSLVLSYLPTAEQRLQMIRKARSLLVTPPPASQGAEAEPHRTGLLLIVEKDSIFGSENMVETVGQNRSVLLTNWKQAICNEGFDLVKYRHLKTGGERMSHVFAFATKPVVPGRDICTTEVEDRRIGSSGKVPTLCIKQDFDAHVEHLGAESAESSPAEEWINISRVISTRPIGIIGGGIGGCALALSLQQKKIPFVLFEKDESFDTRKQGYALTMQQGGPALRALGLGDLLSTYGTISTRHNSYRWDGSRLGSYGLSKRLPITTGGHPAAAADESQMMEGTSEVPVVSSSGEERQPLVQLLKSKTRHNVHIPRQKLREIMMQSINPTAVLWNKKLVSADVQNVADSVDPIVEAQFADGTSQQVCALVGADGIFSSVRQQVNDLICRKKPKEDDESAADIAATRPQEEQHERLKYLGLMVILGIAPNSPDLPLGADSALAPGGSTSTSRQQCQWLDGETRVFSMPFDSNHTMWQLSYPCDEADALQLSGATAGPSIANAPSFIKTNDADTPVENCRTVIGQRLKREALQRCKGWAADLVSLLSSADPSLVSGHPVYDRDPQHLSVLRPTDTNIATNEEAISNISSSSSSENTSIDIPFRPADWPITLLGDAAHPMSPFKGQGANQAILDALALSKAISSSNLFGSQGIRSLRSVQADGGLVNSVSNKCNARRRLSENLRLYESEMYTKGAEKVQRSRDAAFYLHNESALAEGNITRAKAAEEFAAAESRH